MKRLFPILLFVVVFAGCVAATPASKPITVSETPSGAGSILGRLVDDEERPLEGFPITLVELFDVRMTDAEGRFTFAEVAAGTYTLVLSQPEYAQIVQPVVVESGVESAVSLTAMKLPEFQPHNLTVAYRGHYDCAAEYAIITGHCGILWEYTTCAAQSCQSDPAFTQAYQFPLEVLPRWDTIVAELTWTASASNGLGGMRMYVENTNVTEQAGHSVKVARTEGADQPLHIRIDRGVTQPGAEYYNGTTQPAFIPDDGGLQQVRVFPMGHAYDATSQACLPSFGCFLGFGVGAGIDFELLVTVFYNGSAPEGFAAER